jgi:hypothetical protein
MTTTTAVSAAVDAWTLAYTASGAVTVVLQHVGPGQDLKVRIGASVTTGDALTSAAEFMYPREARSFTLANGDKIMVSPAQPSTSGGVAIPVIVRG